MFFKKEYSRIDENGKYIEPVIVDYVKGEDPDEKVDQYHISEKWNKRLFNPVWDFEQKEWTEGMSDESVQQKIDHIEQQNKQTEALRFLDNTDWYVIRQMETGKGIPDDIKNKRETMRELLSTIKP